MSKNVSTLRYTGSDGRNIDVISADSIKSFEDKRALMSVIEAAANSYGKVVVETADGDIINSVCSKTSDLCKNNKNISYFRAFPRNGVSFDFYDPKVKL